MSHGRFYRARNWKRRTQPRVDLTNAEPISLLYPLATSILLLDLTLKSVWLNPVRDFDPQ